MNKIYIDDVSSGSPADKSGIVKGDYLLSINGKNIIDIFDYRFFASDKLLEVCIERFNEQKTITVKKGEYEDFGLVFYEGLIDDAKSCKNKCIFCFIDQLPKGMRDTLYFKDDDSRLSFLEGNYVTLTNMSEADLERIAFYKLSPINVSIHATDLAVRKFMLKNPNSDKLFTYLNKLHESGIDLNFQIVLMKGVNDGKILEKSIMDLAKYAKDTTSLSIVPIGISKYREGLHKVEPFTEEDCKNVIKQVEVYQNLLRQKIGTRFVFASDEFYLNGNVPIPPYERYEDFPQISNGVGMIATLLEEIKEDFYPYEGEKRTVSLVTGALAYDTIRSICDKIEKESENIKINVFKVVNEFFGELITVSGLMTGEDILKTLKGKDLGEKVLLPINAVKRYETILLDDIYVEDLEKELNVPFEIVEDGALQLLDSIYN